MCAGGGGELSLNNNVSDYTNIYIYISSKRWWCERGKSDGGECRTACNVRCATPVVVTAKVSRSARARASVYIRSARNLSLRTNRKPLSVNGSFLIFRRFQRTFPKIHFRIYNTGRNGNPFATRRVQSQPPRIRQWPRAPKNYVLISINRCRRNTTNFDRGGVRTPSPIPYRLTIHSTLEYSDDVRL